MNVLSCGLSYTIKTCMLIMGESIISNFWRTIAIMTKHCLIYMIYLKIEPKLQFKELKDNMNLMAICLLLKDVHLPGCLSSLRIYNSIYDLLTTSDFSHLLVFFIVKDEGKEERSIQISFRQNRAGYL